jgi:hypothetical protein
MLYMFLSAESAQTPSLKIFVLTVVVVGVKNVQWVHSNCTLYDVRCTVVQQKNYCTLANTTRKTDERRDDRHLSPHLGRMWIMEQITVLLVRNGFCEQFVHLVPRVKCITNNHVDPLCDAGILVSVSSIGFILAV